MSLQLIFGNSGSGKSEFIQSHIMGESAAQMDTNFYMLVPEQFTIQNQWELVSRQEHHGIMNIDVVSFQRLAYRVFHELGMHDLKVLEETGKNFVLRKVAEEKKDELKMLGANRRKCGYINEIKSVISELTQYRIKPDMLKEFLEDARHSAAFRYKLADINTIYEGFLEFLQGSYITAEEVLEVLADVVDQSALLKGSVVILDGFTGFTPIQYHLLEQLMKVVKDVYVTIAMDKREDPFTCLGIQELFFMSKETVHALMQIADRTKTQVKEPIKIWHGPNSRFFKAPALLWLEQNLFRKSPAVYGEEVADIFMYSLPNPRQELVFLAEEICRLVREEGYRYKDIAIVCGDTQLYGNYAEEIFPSYHIPLFLDKKKNLLFQPLTELIRSTLLVVEQDFSYEHVISYLRCGLAGFAEKEIDLLENYVLANRIRGYRRWKEKWVRLNGVSANKELAEEELAAVNEVRERIVQLFETIRAIRSKRTTVIEKTRALYGHMQELKVQMQLEERAKFFSKNGEPTLAKEYEQVYKIVIDLLDKFVELLGEESMTGKEYREILEAGFEAASIGIVPLGYDRVVCGDIERTRLSPIKVLFFVGVNDGFIPKSAVNGGMISQQEREVLAKNHMQLSPTIRERSFIQKFYLYLTLTKPSEKLYLTWFRVSSEGKEARKSYLVGTLQTMFPNILLRALQSSRLKDDSAFKNPPIGVSDRKSMAQELAHIVTPKSSRSFFVEGLNRAKQGKTTPVWRTLYQWYEQDSYWADAIKPFFYAAFPNDEEQRIGKDITRALYSTVLENSVSRLERFCSCAFSHFLDYGLLLKERQLGEFAASDLGSLFHTAIERYARNMQEAGFHWFDVPPNMKEKLMEQAIIDTLAETGNPMLFDGARNAYTIERVKRILRRSIDTISHQIEESHFFPEDYEVFFSFEQDLQSVDFALDEKVLRDEKMRLSGRIDRMDTKECEDKLYVKIVDYKSGNTQFQLISVYYGLRLQLVAYMNAAVELLKKKYPDRKVVPSGMFYYHVDDPIVEGDASSSEAEIREKIFEQLKLKGMGSDATDTSVSKKSQQVADSEMQIISNYVNRKIQSIGSQIIDGNIKANPYLLGDKSGCDYCPYHGVCGFDKRLPGYGYRRLPDLKKKEEILEKMQEFIHPE
ncbi:PD-(D/E)XK nuclease family protein [Lachnospiraceae bacterium ZAX-1]